MTPWQVVIVRLVNARLLLVIFLKLASNLTNTLIVAPVALVSPLTLVNLLFSSVLKTIILLLITLTHIHHTLILARLAQTKMNQKNKKRSMMMKDNHLIKQPAPFID
jgi:cell shape-determining protein MreC